MKIKNLLLSAVLVLTSTMFAQTQIGASIIGNIFNNSGFSVSLSSDGSIVAIGAPFSNENANNSGCVRIYRNVSGIWTQVGANINGEAADDQSGRIVSLSSDGSIVAIGARFNDGNGFNSGHVRVYRNVSGTWTQIGSDINGEAADDESGISVSLSSDGSILAIGATSNDGNGFNSGHVRVYRNVSGTWTQIGSDINGEAADDGSGISVSLSSDGSILAIGAAGNDENGASSGHVRVYRNVTGTWIQVGADINGEAATDYSGNSVSLSSDGSILAIGATFNDGNGFNSGHVRVYRNVSGTWTQVGADINGVAINDRSGWIVSLSSDGSILAIGNYTPNPGDLGRVRVYRNVSGTWTQVGASIIGEAGSDATGLGDWNGYSVSLSSDGSIVAIGAPGNDGNGFNSGRVRVYDLSAVLSSDSFVLNNFTVYPNPTTEILNISLNTNLILKQVNIYNTIGQLLQTENKQQINISSLAKGSYFVEVITNQGKATKTMVVQ